MIVKFELPKDWNDLDSWQLRNFSWLLHSGKKGHLFDFYALKTLLKLRWSNLRGFWKFFVLLRQVSLSDIKEHYQWVYNSTNLTKFIPFIKAKKQRLYSPSQHLYNLTIDEFSYAEDFYLGWLKTNDIEYIQYLTAVLYREFSSFGKRSGFDYQEIEYRASQLTKLDIKTLLSIVKSYEGCRFSLANKFPAVFSSDHKKSAKIPLSSGFKKVILSLSGGKFGPHKHTKEINLYVFLHEYSSLIKQTKNA